MTTATMESQPNKGNRTVFTVTSYGKDGSERKKYAVKESGLFKFVIAACVVWFLATTGLDTLAIQAKRHEADGLKPKMEALADQGKVEAALWLAKNYWASNKQRLATLAVRGNAEAMFYQGILTLKSGDKVAAMGWIGKAAAAGYAPAVLYMDGEQKR